MIAHIANQSEMFILIQLSFCFEVSLSKSECIATENTLKPIQHMSQKWITKLNSQGIKCSNEFILLIYWTQLNVNLNENKLFFINTRTLQMKQGIFWDQTLLLLIKLECRESELSVSAVFFGKAHNEYTSQIWSSRNHSWKFYVYHFLNWYVSNSNWGQCSHVVPSWCSWDEGY